MLRLLIAAAVVSVSVLMIARADNSATQESTPRVLFERAVGEGGQKLVVLRGPERDPSLLAFLQGDKSSRGGAALRQATGLTEIRVELRSAQADPILLASWVHIDGPTKSDKGVSILDCLIKPGNIFLAVSEGASLGIVNVAAGAGARPVPMELDKPWTPISLATALDERMVAMSLGTTGDGRLTLKVTDKRVGQHTLYEQKNLDPNKTGILQLSAVRQWRDELR